MERPARDRLPVNRCHAAADYIATNVRFGRMPPQRTARAGLVPPAGVTVLTLLLLALLPAVAAALPPNPPGAGKTRVAIKRLKVASPLSMGGYSRARFPHWLSQ